MSCHIVVSPILRINYKITQLFQSQNRFMPVPHVSDVLEMMKHQVNENYVF